MTPCTECKFLLMLSQLLVLSICPTDSARSILHVQFFGFFVRNEFLNCFRNCDWPNVRTRSLPMIQHLHQLVNIAKPGTSNVDPGSFFCRYRLPAVLLMLLLGVINELLRVFLGGKVLVPLLSVIFSPFSRNGYSPTSSLVQGRKPFWRRLTVNYRSTSLEDAILALFASF